MLEAFHFIRPWWLMALLPALYIAWRVLRRGDARQDWQPHIDPYLLDHLLTVDAAAKRWKPVHLLLMLWVVAVITLAGPAWRREPSPFARDSAPLFILLKITPSMLEDDIAPSRLERAHHKIADLLAARAGARNGLMAYAGSAHLVMPLTLDASAITLFTEGLRPEIMPRTGDALGQAIERARSMLNNTEGGTILLIADEATEDALAAANRALDAGAPPLHVWTAHPEGSKELARLARTSGGSYATFTPDDTDVLQLASAISRTASSQPQDGGDRWRDEGYWLTPVLALGMLGWFRKGWVLP